MNYTKIPSDIEIELNRLKTEPFDIVKCMDHPAYFMYHFLGIMPFRYQYMILNEFAKGGEGKTDRVIICKPRQIGISVMIMCLAIWYAFFNKCKTGVGKNTKVLIISRDEGAAKKLMSEIQRICFNSEKMRDAIPRKKYNPMNKKEMYFKEGFIKCFAPTRAVAGESGDLLLVDEAAFVDDDNFKEAMEPTVSATGGKIILSSTPNGQKGFYYEIFDPDDTKKSHEYKRYWFHWKVVESDQQRRIIENKLKVCKETGNLKSFDQEYNALFTVDNTAFFEDGDIENGIDRGLVQEYENKEVSCSVGLDFGGVQAQTAISVTKNEGGKIILIYQWAQPDFDENKLMDKDWENSIPNLCKRYNVTNVVCDFCAQGTTTIKKLESEGYPVVKFDFRSEEKNRGFYLFRTGLKKGTIRYPDLRALIAEMRTVQESRTDQGNTRIKSPKGYSCDRVDSLVMSCYPFLGEEGSFTSIVAEYDKINEKIIKDRQDGRFDAEWDNLTATSLFKEETRGRPEKENGKD